MTLSRPVLGAALCLVGLCLAALPVSAVGAAGGTVQPYFSVVQTGDADVNSQVISSAAMVLFFDANNDHKPQAVNPHEPVYVDLDGSRTVTYGDVRLSSFAGYAAGSVVDAPDTDLGRMLDGNGWFGQTASHAWYVDTDGNDLVSAGDIDLATLDPVLPGASTAGTALTGAEAGGQPRSQIWWHDASGVMRREPGATMYLALGQFFPGPHAVTATDLRFTPLPVGAPPPAATPSAPPSATPTTSAIAPASPATTTVVTSAGNSGGGLGPIGFVLVVLSIVNLVGLVLVVRRLPKAPPKNPF